MISFTGGLWPTLSNIGIALAAVAAIIGLVVWWGRRRGSRTIVIDTALTLSGVSLILSAVGIVVFIVKVFVVDFAEFQGANAAWFDWPTSFPCAEFGATGAVTCGGENLGDFTIGGASLGLRMLAGAAAVSTQLFTSIPAALLAAICFQTLRGRTFSTTVTRVLMGGAIAVLVLGISTDLLGSIAATTGLREVLSPESEWYPQSYSLTVTPLPFTAALGLAALAAVFRQGLRLQREHEALQKDTEGLV